MQRRLRSGFVKAGVCVTWSREQAAAVHCGLPPLDEAQLEADPPSGVHCPLPLPLRRTSLSWAASDQGIAPPASCPATSPPSTPLPPSCPPHTPSAAEAQPVDAEL